MSSRLSIVLQVCNSVFLLVDKCSMLSVEDISKRAVEERGEHHWSCIV